LNQATATNGHECLFCVQASDFAVARFRFLTRLLLVHGHWNYHRITNTVLYFFFKNSIFVYLLLWYVRSGVGHMAPVPLEISILSDAPRLFCFINWRLSGPSIRNVMERM
jgi:magnesium-transporting ATPase (P-type)